MMKPLDITGQRFGRLMAIKRTDEKDKWNRCYMWECKCDCGEVCTVAVDQLRNGFVKSCGCLARESRMRDVAGQRFGRLVALERTDKIKFNSTVWRFRCDCGNVIEVRLSQVADNHKLSCGCLDLENKRKQAVLMQMNCHRENGTNVALIRSDVIYRSNSSGYRGVAWHKHTQKYVARINFKGKSYSLGYFDDPAKASEAYETAKTRMHKRYIEERERGMGEL